MMSTLDEVNLLFLLAFADAERGQNAVVQSTAYEKHGSRYSAQENHQKNVAWAKGINEGKHIGIARYGIAAKDFSQEWSVQAGKKEREAQQAAARKKDKAAAAAARREEQEKRPNKREMSKQRKKR